MDEQWLVIDEAADVIGVEKCDVWVFLGGMGIQTTIAVWFLCPRRRKRGGQHWPPGVSQCAIRLGGRR